jgi:hypothetical protein
MAHAAEPTNTPAPTRRSVPAAAPLAGAATALVTAPLAVSPNLEPARAAPTLSLPTVPAVLMGRLARDSVKANVAAPPGTVESTKGSAALAASLYSELVNLLRRTSRQTAPVALTARHVLVSVKEAAAALPDTAELGATSAVLAASLVSEPATTEPRTSQRMVSVARTAKHVRDLQRANVAALLGTAGPVAISAAPVVKQASGLATTTREASRQTANAVRMARRAKGMLRVSVAALLDIAEPGAISAALVARRASGLVAAALEAFRLMDSVARMARLARDSPRVSVVLPLGIAAKTLPSAALAASPPLAYVTAAPEPSPPTESAAAGMARRARASPKEIAAVQTGTVAVLPTTVPPAARGLSAYATPVLARSQLTEHAVARTVGSAKASQRESVAAQTATVALRRATVVPVARMHSASAAAVRAPSQLMEIAPRTGRPVRARAGETAAALPITAARRPLIAALDGKWTPT